MTRPSWPRSRRPASPFAASEHGTGPFTVRSAVPVAARPRPGVADRSQAVQVVDVRGLGDDLPTGTCGNAEVKASTRWRSRAIRVISSACSLSRPAVSG